jgi:GNAT superfamily N-acetyltransferase
MDRWQIEPFNVSHQRGEFCCGKAPLDDFLRSLISQYEKRKLGRTYVAIVPGNPRVYGYYTLAASSVAFQSLPPGAAKKLPRHRVPVVLLGRLAVDKEAQGRGFGEELLMDALRRCVQLSQNIGIHAVEVMAIDADAKRFYLKYGFTPLADEELHLFLPIRTIEQGFLP